jgi:cytochrome P450
MEKYVNETIDRVIAQRLRDGAKTKHSVLLETSSPGKAVSPKTTPPRSPGSPGRSPGSPGRSPSAKKRNSSAEDETKRLDAVEMFMNVEPPLSAVELRDVVKGLILGGRDTTGVSIMWSLYEISKNPDVEAKLREECKEFPTDDPVAFYNAIRKAKYIDAVVRETIRLYSPVPLDARKALKDDVMPDGSFVGAGWVVCFAPYAMGRDTAQWGPDACEWKPSRWLEGELAKKEPSPFVYSMFQAGPRICLGKDLALLEAKSCVALLMKAGLKLRAWPGAEEPRYKMGITLAIDADVGLPMKVEFVDV